MHRIGGGSGGGASSWWCGVAAALIVYASLYPLTGWDHPAGWGFWHELTLPWPRYATRFDTVSNVLGYVPLGGLVALALARDRRWGVGSAAIGAVLAGSALSLSLEMLQHLLPGRVPSALDWVCNTLGSALGALLALPLQVGGWLDAWQRRHDRWFRRGRAGGTTLLALWPLALLFPTPVPLGLGQVFDPLGEVVARWVDETPLEAPARQVLGLVVGDPAGAAHARPPLGRAAELLLVAASMATPCLLAFTLATPGWRRVVLAAGGAVVALAGLSLSAALNFGPQHAFAWQTPQALAGIGVGAASAVALAWVTPRLAAALGLVALTAALSLVAMAPSDPYFDVSLAAWEQGRFIRFHGASQWIGWLWPYAAAAYLLRQVAQPR